MEFLLCTLTPEVQCRLVHRNHVIWRTKITKFWRNGNDSKQPYYFIFNSASNCFLLKKFDDIKFNVEILFLVFENIVPLSSLIWTPVYSNQNICSNGDQFKQDSIIIKKKSKTKYNFDTKVLYSKLSTTLLPRFQLTARLV